MARRLVHGLQDNATTTEPNNSTDLVALYIEKKQELDKLEKLVKELGNQLKDDIRDGKVKNCQYNGFKLTRVESSRITWNEDALLAKVKTFNNPELITMVEKVDVEKLQQAIMDDEISIFDVQECQKVTNIVSLKVSKVKEVKE